MSSFIINKKPKYIALLLFAIAWTLIISSMILGLVIASIGKEEASVFLRNTFNLIDLDRESNIPTLYSCALWLFASLLSLYTSQQVKESPKEAYFWRILSFVFLFFTIDEWFGIHERVGDFLATILVSLDFGSYLWIIPGTFAILALILFFLYFMESLPKRCVRLMLLGIVVFVVGSIGMEAFGGLVYRYYGTQDNAIYRILAQLEETLEMMGVIIIIFAILRYLHESLLQHSPKLSRQY